MFRMRLQEGANGLSRQQQLSGFVEGFVQG
jgi:hypothetical protein